MQAMLNGHHRLEAGDVLKVSGPDETRTRNLDREHATTHRRLKSSSLALRASAPMKPPST